MNGMEDKKTIQVAHSPDSDDAFMFYAMAKGKYNTPGLEFVHVLKDIESLNRLAMDGKYEVTAVSFHAYAHIYRKYILLPCGASIGYGYGPIVVTKDGNTSEGVKGKKVAIPGEWTTAYLVLRLYQPNFIAVTIPFDQILKEVEEGAVDAGLIIHEGQLTYASYGFTKIVDLGDWWLKKTKLPLPLGGNVIRRDLGKELIGKVGYCIKQSILYSLDHREEALGYAASFARGLDSTKIDRFVQMYVNQRTVEYDDESKEAIRILLDEGYKQGVIKEKVIPEFVDIPNYL